MQILLGILDSIRRAISWATGTTTNQVFTDAVYAPLANGSYFAFGNTSLGAATTSYQYSTDGNTWSTGTLPASAKWSAAAANGSRIVVFREAATTGYYSDNGTTWTATNALNVANNLSPVFAIWDGTRFIITEGSSTPTNKTVRYSTDGITWLGAQVSNGGPGTLAIGYDGVSRYIVTTYEIASVNASYTTTFPTGWASITLPSANYWQQAVYGNGIWVIGQAGSANYATSTNGTTWTSRVLPSVFSESASDRKVKFLFDSGKFYYYYTDNVYTSTDGITWAVDKTLAGGSLDNLTGWAVGPSKIVGVGYDSLSVGSTTYLNGSK